MLNHKSFFHFSDSCFGGEMMQQVSAAHAPW